MPNTTVIMEIKPESYFIVKTRIGRELSVYTSNIFTARDLDAVTKELQNLHNPADERRPADISYNCHGFTFIGKLGWFATSVPMSRLYITGREVEGVVEREQRRTLSPEKEIMALLDDNSYTMIAHTPNINISPPQGRANPEIGDIVLYKTKRLDGISIDHSGIIVKFCPEPFVLSKFGFGGEYFHPIKRVPEAYGKIVEIWTDRKVTL